VSRHWAGRLAAVVLLGSGALASAATGGADDLYAQAGKLLAAGQTDEAAARLQEALAIDPRHWQSLCRLGEIDTARHLYAEAERLLRAGLEIKPDSGACLSRLAQVLLLDNRVGEAEPLLVRAASLSPGDEATLFNLGRVYETTGRPELAIDVYRRQLAAVPQGQRATSALLKVARLSWAVKRPVDAVQSYQTFLERQPDQHDVRAELAAILFATSRYDESMIQYEKVIAAGAAGATGFANAGSICLLRNDLPRAIDYLGRAVAADPHPIPARIALASALTQSGDPARAVEVLHGIIADDPENQRAWFLLGQSLMKLGRAEESREAFKRHQSIHEKIMRERMSGQPEAHP